MKIALTDVTYMHGGRICIAGWDLDAMRMVRPLPSPDNGATWQADQARPDLFATGNVVQFELSGVVPRSRFPHMSEDVVVTGQFSKIDELTMAALHQSALPSVKATPEAIFYDNLEERRCVVEGTQCPSLGAVVTNPRRIGFRERQRNNGLQLRAWFYVGNSQAGYELAVTSTQLRDIWSAQGLEAVNGFVHRAANAHIRIGLARAVPHHSGRQLCFAMVNNIILF